MCPAAALTQTRESLLYTAIIEEGSLSMLEERQAESPVSIFPFRSSPCCESCGAGFPHSLTRHADPRRSFSS
jgi:hypothetical protein